MFFFFFREKGLILLKPNRPEYQRIPSSPHSKEINALERGPACSPNAKQESKKNQENNAKRLKC